MPDFDIDFSPRYVNKVIDYVIDKYGKDHTSRIGSVGTMKSRLAVKDVARTLGCSVDEIEEFGKLIPEMLRGGTGDNLVTVELCLNPTKEFLEHYEKEMQKFNRAYQSNLKFQEVINIAARVEGLPKSSGITAAGVLISPVSLSKTVPLRLPKKAERSEDEEDQMNDVPVTDWNLKAIEELGLVKFDFLVLDSLDIIDDTVKAVKADLGIDIDWDTIPEDDLLTFDMLSAGDTYGVFQLTEVWLADFCKQFKPKSIRDISTISALYRPGPKDNGMVDAILQVRKTGIVNRYPIPVVNEILQSTNSVLTYQEQILEIAVKVAGYTLSQADLLRRAMGKKDKAVMMAEQERFISGAKKVSGASEKDAAELFNVIQRFSEYCFNLSHSIAYSVISFRMAYLKCHYPVYFHAADLTSKAAKSFDKLLPSLNDAKRHGLKILPPDVNRSTVDFSVLDSSTILFGFGGMKSLGSNTIDSIKEARAAGLFKDLKDFCLQIDASKVNIGHIKQLCFAGAFDSIEPRMNRAEQFEYVEQLTAAMKKERDRSRLDKKNGQMGLFGSIEAIAPISVTKPKKVFSFEETLRLEREIMGLYISGSPIDPYSDMFSKKQLDYIGSLFEEPNLYVNLLGVIIERRDFMTKNGPACEIVLEDSTGQIPVRIWGDKLPSVNSVLFQGNVILVHGKTAVSRGLAITANSIVEAKSEALQMIDKVKIRNLSSELIRYLKFLRPGNIPVDLEIGKTYRYRLGLFDIDLVTLGKINELDTI